MFGRIHKFSTTLFDQSVKPRTKQSAWNNKQGKANMCVWFWVCNLLIYFSAHVLQIGRPVASECLPGTRVPWAITVPVWPLSGAWCQSAWCAARVWRVSCPVGWMLHQGLHRIPTSIVASSKNLLLWGRQGRHGRGLDPSMGCIGLGWVENFPILVGWVGLGLFMHMIIFFCKPHDIYLSLA